MGVRARPGEGVARGLPASKVLAGSREEACGPLLPLTVGMAGMMLPGGDVPGPWGRPSGQLPRPLPPAPPRGCGAVLCGPGRGAEVSRWAGRGGVAEAAHWPAAMPRAPQGSWGPVQTPGWKAPQPRRRLSPGEEGFPRVLCPRGSPLPPRELSRCLSWGCRRPGPDTRLPRTCSAGLCCLLAGEAALLGLVGLWQGR